jgi:hypothetical protein
MIRRLVVDEALVERNAEHVIAQAHGCSRKMRASMRSGACRMIGLKSMRPRINDDVAQLHPKDVS